VCHHLLIGWRMLAYTVNDEAEARRLKALNVDGPITDNLARPA
jgi:glycerophosphoryl diester phosphodiesterase